MAWEVEYTDQFEAWWLGLTTAEQDSIDNAVRVLQEEGPGLGRPLVDTMKGSRHANMKELRPRSGNIRILFAFDPRRAAILLIGGDKTGRWNDWYRAMIPVADALYDEHLRQIEQEGDQRWRRTSASSERRSNGSGTPRAPCGWRRNIRQC